MRKIIVPRGIAPHIWTRRPKIVEPRDPINISGLGMAGEFRLQVYRPDGRCRHDTGFFPNLITDIGLDQPGGVSPSLQAAISVGTDNTPPTNSDTTLGTRVATSTSDQGSGYTASVGTPGDPDWYTAYTFIRRFGAGAAAGNLAEIGVTASSTPWNCFSRALILDGGGSPTTLTVLSDEYLDATYRLRWYAGNILSDVEDTLTITGSGDHDIVLRRSDVDGGGNMWRPSFTWNAGQGGLASACQVYNGSIGDITARPSGTGDGASSATNATYTPGNFYRDYSVVWGLDDGNVAGGISAVFITAGGGRVAPGSGGSAAAAYQFSLDPVISKNDTQILTLNFRQSWARRSI